KTKRKRFWRRLGWLLSCCMFFASRCGDSRNNRLPTRADTEQRDDNTKHDGQGEEGIGPDIADSPVLVVELRADPKCRKYDCAHEYSIDAPKSKAERQQQRCDRPCGFGHPVGLAASGPEQ